MRATSFAGRVTAASQILISLAGIALIVTALDPIFGPPMLAFVRAIAGLVVTGSAEFVPDSAAVYRASLRVLGLVPLAPMMVTLLVMASRGLGS
jgi:hypothetical protein